MCTTLFVVIGVIVVVVDVVIMYSGRPRNYYKLFRRLPCNSAGTTISINRRRQQCGNSRVLFLFTRGCFFPSPSLSRTPILPTFFFLHEPIICFHTVFFIRLFVFVLFFSISAFRPAVVSRSRQEAQAETPQEIDVAAGRDHVRQTDADGTAGHGHDRREGAQSAPAGRRLADHIQADAAKKVQRRRRRRRRRRLGRRLGPGGRVVVGQGRPERAPARVRRPVGRGQRGGCGVRHAIVVVVATAATAHVPVVRAARLSRSRLTGHSDNDNYYYCLYYYY